MSLSNQIEADITQAMKTRDQEQLDALRMVRAACKNEQIALGHTLDDEENFRVLGRLIKQRLEAAEHFHAAGRTETAAKETREAELIKSYLPSQLSDDQLIQLIEAVITETRPNGPADFGKVMGQVMARTKGQADGNRVSQFVRQRLT